MPIPPTTSTTSSSQYDLSLGHPQSYFEDLLAEAESKAFIKGRWTGVFCAGVTAVASGVASHQGVKIAGVRVGTYHASLATILVGLVSSQLATHFSYIADHQLINEQRRREAAYRAEMRRRMDMKAKQSQ